jgi:hypothetical protein
MKKYFIEIFSIFIFIILIPLFSHVNFYQNDDWNRNTSLLRFLNGDFSLLDVTATTFYSQGILGYIWALIFGIEKIPFLTLLISILNFYIFYKILEKLSKFSKITNFLISLILFFNVLHAYSSVGFMTENYLLFYFLIAIFYYVKFEKEDDLKNLWISNFFSFLGFYAKQNALIFPVGLALYFLINKKWRELEVQITSISGILFSYYLFFPRTNEMQDKDFDFVNLLNFNYSYSLTYSILIYLAFFSLPFIFKFIIDQKNLFKFKTILISIFVSTVFFFTFNYFFKPGEISWEEFPYLENTFERTGFLPRTLSGTKYQFKYNFDLYSYIDLISKISIAVVISIIILNKERFKILNNPYLISLVVGLGLMIFVEVFFDRYLLLLVPLIYLYLINLIKDDSFIFKVVLSFYLFFIGFFAYFLTLDFIYTQNYVWTKSQELVLSGFAKPEEINATGAWKKLYKPVGSKYLFTYDSFNKNKELKDSYQLVEEKAINFKGNLFINPTIYLFKIKNQ